MEKNPVVRKSWKETWGKFLLIATKEKTELIHSDLYSKILSYVKYNSP